MFEQCLPYKDLSLEKELTCDVLIDDDDLLSQLSSQLDIPSFVDQGKADQVHIFQLQGKHFRSQQSQYVSLLKSASHRGPGVRDVE